MTTPRMFPAADDREAVHTLSFLNASKLARLGGILAAPDLTMDDVLSFHGNVYVARTVVYLHQMRRQMSHRRRHEKLAVFFRLAAEQRSARADATADLLATLTDLGARPTRP